MRSFDISDAVKQITGCYRYICGKSPAYSAHKQPVMHSSAFQRDTLIITGDISYFVHFVAGMVNMTIHGIMCCDEV